MCLHNPWTPSVFLTSIISNRAYTISRQHKLVLYFLSCLYIAVVSVFFSFRSHVLTKSLTHPLLTGTMVYNFIYTYEYVVALQHSLVTHLKDFLVSLVTRPGVSNYDIRSNDWSLKKGLPRMRESSTQDWIIRVPAHSRIPRCSLITENQTQWIFYLCCVVWDVVTLLLSLYYLSQIRTTLSLWALFHFSSFHFLQLTFVQHDQTNPNVSSFHLMLDRLAPYS